MKNQFKHIFVAMLLFLFTPFAFADTFPGGDDPVQDVTAKEWTLYKEYTGVQVYYKAEECHDISNGLHQEWVLLKFVNTTDQELQLDYYIQVWVEGKCTNCDDLTEEHHFQVVVPAGGSIMGECESFGNLKIFSKFLNYDLDELTHFELIDVKVNIK